MGDSPSRKHAYIRSFCYPQSLDKSEKSVLSRRTKVLRVMYAIPPHFYFIVAMHLLPILFFF